jgi:hypothetical protein
LRNIVILMACLNATGNIPSQAFTRNSHEVGA